MPRLLAWPAPCKITATKENRRPIYAARSLLVACALLVHQQARKTRSGRYYSLRCQFLLATETARPRFQAYEGCRSVSSRKRMHAATVGIAERLSLRRLSLQKQLL